MEHEIIVTGSVCSGLKCSKTWAIGNLLTPCWFMRNGHGSHDYQLDDHTSNNQGQNKTDN